MSISWYALNDLKVCQLRLQGVIVFFSSETWFIFVIISEKPICAFTYFWTQLGHYQVSAFASFQEIQACQQIYFPETFSIFRDKCGNQFKSILHFPSPFYYSQKQLQKWEYVSFNNHRNISHFSTLNPPVNPYLISPFQSIAEINSEIKLFL